MLERVFFGTVAYIRSIRWHRGNCPPFLPSHVENTKKATEHRHGIPSLFGHVHLEIAMGFVLKCWEQHGTPMHIYIWICIYSRWLAVGIGKSVRQSLRIASQWYLGSALRIAACCGCTKNCRQWYYKNALRIRRPYHNHALRIVSTPSGTPKSSIFYSIFYCKPSILGYGYPHLYINCPNHPFWGTPMWKILCVRNAYETILSRFFPST